MEIMNFFWDISRWERHLMIKTEVHYSNSSYLV